MSDYFDFMDDDAIDDEAEQMWLYDVDYYLDKTLTPEGILSLYNEGIISYEDAQDMLRRLRQQEPAELPFMAKVVVGMWVLVIIMIFILILFA